MKSSDLLLYAVTACGCSLESIRAVLRGGVTFLQLREKKLPHDEFLKKALLIKEFCRVPFVINDNLDVALESGADGVHIGQSDAVLSETRRRLGPNKIIGVSAVTVEQALAAERDGADYLGVGAVFPTGTKPDADFVAKSTLQEICACVNIPVVAIGGILESNVMELKGTGVDGVAVVSALFGKPDPEAAAQSFLRKITPLF